MTNATKLAIMPAHSPMSLPCPELAFMFDLGGEAPPSFSYEGYALLVLSLVVLPLGFWFLCLKMASAGLPKPLVIPYFCIFGSVGGFAFSLLIIPFGLLALPSLLASLLYVTGCRPFTPYHRGAAIGCGVLLVLPILCAAFR